MPSCPTYDPSTTPRTVMVVNVYDFRPVHQRTRDGHALLLSSGHLRGVVPARSKSPTSTIDHLDVDVVVVLGGEKHDEPKHGIEHPMPPSVGIAFPITTSPVALLELLSVHSRWWC